MEDLKKIWVLLFSEYPETDEREIIGFWDTETEVKDFKETLDNPNDSRYFIEVWDNIELPF